MCDKRAKWQASWQTKAEEFLNWLIKQMYELICFSLSIFMLSGENSFHHQVQDIQTEYVGYQPVHVVQCSSCAQEDVCTSVGTGYFLHTVSNTWKPNQTFAATKRVP